MNIVNSSNMGESQVNLESLPANPRLRKISEYHPNIKDKVRRTYILKEPCQLVKHKFPYGDTGGSKQKFNEDWFTEYKDLLEYNIKKDVMFCLCCYLFRLDTRNQGSNNLAFEASPPPSGHITEVDVLFSSHISARRLVRFDALCIHAQTLLCPVSCRSLRAWPLLAPYHDKDQHIEIIMHKRSDKAICDYHTRLLASTYCVRFLLCRGSSFRGYDELLESSSNNGNFYYFTILIDESRDVSIKEQITVVMRGVNNKRETIERVIGEVHVTNATCLSLKGALDSLFTKCNLTISAFYAHFFAHQLQITLVVFIKNYDEMNDCFDDTISNETIHDRFQNMKIHHVPL
uniref:DUF4371 domain-containing protein n=1 Tax=Kalanchoe fedtschenkoi TaxID=63787 RepID=A0A7N0T9B3_KALFE